MKIEHVKKGESVWVDCQGGVARKPAPSDGYLITHNSTVIFVTDKDLKNARQIRSER